MFLEEKFKSCVFDTSHPRSMVNLLPASVQNRVLSQPVQDLVNMPEEELEKLVNPSVSIRRLRTAFWMEYERAMKADNVMHSKIRLYSVCCSVCSEQFFLTNVVHNNYALAWIIRPLANYTVALEEALYHGINRLREILNFPLYRPRMNPKTGDYYKDKQTGQILYDADANAATVVLKTVALLDLRVRGAIPRTINQYSQVDKRSLNMNVRAAQGNSKVTIDGDALDNKLLSIEDLDQKIRDITKETAKMINNPVFTIPERNRIHEYEDELTERDLPHGSNQSKASSD